MNSIKKILRKIFKNKHCFTYNKKEYDPLTDKLFKHYKTKKTYRYLFAAISKDHKDGLVVVYQDIEDDKIYTRKWNEFFGCVGPENNRKARFEEL